MNRYADGDALDRENCLGDVRREVGLRQHHNGLGAALPGDGDVALEPAQAEVVVEPGEQESRVDVRREHLLGRILAGVLADERTSTREDRRDRGRWCHRDPVADGRQLPTYLAVVEETPGG